jgi:hypothetical protein
MYRGATKQTFNRIFDAALSASLDPGVGVLYLELAQVFRAEPTNSGLFSIGVLRPAESRAQVAHRPSACPVDVSGVASAARAMPKSVTVARPLRWSIRSSREHYHPSDHDHVHFIGESSRDGGKTRAVDFALYTRQP